MLLVVVSVLLLILILGVLITAHEFGHFITAKLSGIRVHEFAIGMGPKLWKKRKGETLYSLRAFPIGGFCALAEDEEPDPNDPRAFPNAKRHRRALVLAAGSLMNFLAGLLLLVVINLPVSWYVDTKLSGTMPGFAFAGEDGFLPGDRIVNINGHAIYVNADIQFFLSLGAGEPFDITLARDGRQLTLRDLPLTRSVPDETGTLRYGFYFEPLPATLGVKLQQAWYGAVDNVRLVWVSLGDLIGGRARVDDLMGPVGMGGVVNDIVQDETATVGVKTMGLLNLAAFLAINLATMNLLPLPALDGGRLFFLAIDALLALTRRKPLNPKYEGYIHAAGMILFFGLMIFVFFNDILRLFGWK
ncbi:MAG: site-2 protease family protein [Oscillospiraceae bacterium]|nr:site-2 protease family protein [Oscillospiraceae bacterium]